MGSCKDEGPLNERMENKSESGSFGRESGSGRQSVQVLARSGIDHVPLEFVQPPEHRPLPAPALPESAPTNLPLIDMHDFLGPLRPSALSKLASALEDWGFIQVVNHGVSKNAMDNMRKASRGFFELPMEEKQKWAMKEGEMMGYGRFNVGNQLAVTDWVDFLAHFVSPKYLINDEVTPTNPPHYREAMFAYIEEIKAFIYSLCGIISESLGLEANYIRSTSGEFSAALRLNYYPPCPEPQKVLGVGSHSDGGTLTVLMEDGCTNGLQVLKQGEWITIGIDNPDALIVNIADMLQVLSNGKYTSVEHRAKVDKYNERYSIVIFFFPELLPQLTVKPAPQLLSEGNLAKYHEINYVDYLNFYLHQRTPGKARIDSLKIY